MLIPIRVDPSYSEATANIAVTSSQCEDLKKYMGSDFEMKILLERFEDSKHCRKTAIKLYA